MDGLLREREKRRSLSEQWKRDVPCPSSRE